MSTSLATLESLSYDILREESNSSAYPVTLMDSLLNYAQVAVCAGNIEDPVTKTQVVKGALPFLQKDAFYSTVMDTFLDGNATAGASTLNVSDASDFASSGYLWIDGNIVQYSGKTATSFTGISASTNPIAFSFPGGKRVSQLFALPSDFAQSVSVTFDGSYQIFPQDYRSLFKKKNDYKYYRDYGAFASAQQTNYFQLDGTLQPYYVLINGAYVLPFNVNVTGKNIRLQYEKAPTTMDGSNGATIPDAYATHILPFVAVAEILYERGEEDRATRLLSRACGKIRQMYDYYGQLNTESVFGNRVRTSKDGALNI